MIKDAFIQDKKFYIILDGNTSDIEELKKRFSFFCTPYIWFNTNAEPMLVNDKALYGTKESIAKYCITKGVSVLTTNPELGISTKKIISLDGNLEEIFKRERRQE